MTTRLPIPATIAAAPEASRPLLEDVKKQLGVAPNLFRMVALQRRRAAGDHAKQVRHDAQQLLDVFEQRTGSLGRGRDRGGSGKAHR